jgi:hypothetical protein
MQFKKHTLAIALFAAIQSTLNIGGQTKIVERPGHGRIVKNRLNVNNAEKGKAHASNQSPERLKIANLRRKKRNLKRYRDMYHSVKNQPIMGQWALYKGFQP